MRIVLLITLIRVALGAPVAASDPKAALDDRERARLCVSAIKFVGFRAENGGARRPKVFVIAQRLLQHVSKTERDGLAIIGDAPPFVFPAQASSDTGTLYLRMGLFEPEICRESLDARFTFYVGMENSAHWKIRFRKTDGQWTAISAEIIGMS